ncbi:MAG: histidine kinase N-terminal 7TM domain-containing protein, partial [bacterium]
MANIPFSSWALLSLLAVLTNLAFLIFVLLKNPHSVANRAWSLAILCLLVWGSGQFIMRTTSDYATAEIVQKISGVGFCLLPSPFLHFAVAFTGQKRWLQHRWFYLVLYAPGIIFAFLETQG